MQQDATLKSKKRHRYVWEVEMSSVCSVTGVGVVLGTNELQKNKTCLLQEME
jgi:hypothetical protein